MNIATNQQAKVWDITKKEGKNVLSVQLSTYEGKDVNAKARYSHWMADFVGEAFEKANSLNKEDRIILTNAKIDNVYIKEKEKAYYNVIVFNFEFDENNNIY